MITNLVGYLLNPSTLESNLYFCVSAAIASFLLPKVDSWVSRPCSSVWRHFLDEFSDLSPKEDECAKIVRHICGSEATPWMKMMVAGYALTSQDLQSIL